MRKPGTVKTGPVPPAGRLPGAATGMVIPVRGLVEVANGVIFPLPRLRICAEPCFWALLSLINMLSAHPSGFRRSCRSDCIGKRTIRWCSLAALPRPAANFRRPSGLARTRHAIARGSASLETCFEPLMGSLVHWLGGCDSKNVKGSPRSTRKNTKSERCVRASAHWLGERSAEAMLSFRVLSRVSRAKPTFSTVSERSYQLRRRPETQSQPR